MLTITLGEFKGPTGSEITEAVQKAISGGMGDFAKKIEEKWKEKASIALDTSKDPYLKGLSVDATDNGVKVTLTGFLPVAVETGAQAWDMKPGLLGGAVSKVIPLGARKEFGVPPKGFATVSINSPQDSWWHPGIEAKKIQVQVEQEMDEITKEVFNPLIARISI